MNEIDFFTDLDKLIASDVLSDLAPGEITVRMVMERAQCHHQQARNKIQRWVEAGKMEYVGERREPKRGQKVNAWRMKEQAK